MTNPVLAGRELPCSFKTTSTLKENRLQCVPPAVVFVG